MDRAERYATAAAALAASGLAARGGFHPEAGDGVPPKDGRPVGTLILAGWVDRGGWRAFRASPEVSDGEPDPLDRWSRRTLNEIARALGGHALFPFEGPPYLPFQRWAGRAEPLAASPLGISIHPTYGLWHSFRGALAFAERLELPPRRQAASPCASCRARPCLAACPVSAFTEAGYDLDACLSWLARPEGQDCLDEGCRARRACPVAADRRYLPEQAAFHMRAFRAAQIERGRRAPSET